MKLIALVLLLAFTPFIYAKTQKDTVKVEVKAVHQTSREARDTRALVDKGLFGSTAPNRTVEVYNLDAIINGDKVVLSCADDRGCEAPALGSYDGKLKHNHVKLSFELPVSHKRVSHWYTIAGSWH